MKLLTAGEKKTLLQVGFGTFPSARGGYEDEGRERVDMRQVNALIRRGLVCVSCLEVHAYGLLAGELNLTDEGEKIFEELRQTRRPWE